MRDYYNGTQLLGTRRYIGEPGCKVSYFEYLQPYKCVRGLSRCYRCDNPGAREFVEVYILTYALFIQQ